jgi:hypothetical protein
MEILLFKAIKIQLLIANYQYSLCWHVRVVGSLVQDLLKILKCWLPETSRSLIIPEIK